MPLIGGDGLDTAVIPISRDLGLAMEAAALLRALEVVVGREMDARSEESVPNAEAQTELPAANTGVMHRNAGE